MSAPQRIKPRARSTRSIFAAPAAIAAVSAIGLISALTGDGARDAVSWAALAVPVGAVAWALRFRIS